MIKIYEGHTEDGYMGATKWVGDKSHQHLYGKDLSAAIRQDLKDNGIKGCSVRNSHGKVTVTVKGNDSNKISFEDFKKSDWHFYTYGPWLHLSDRTINMQDWNSLSSEEKNDIVYQLYDEWVVKPKSYQNCNGKGRDTVVFTKAFCDKLQKIDSIIAEFNYDDSNAMVDYFNTNFYYDIDVVIQ